MHGALLRHAVLEGHGHLSGRLYDLGAYPAAVIDRTVSGVVVGEVYRMNEPDRLLPLLDRYEGCTPDLPEPHEYRREVHAVQLADGRRIEAWVYVWNRSTEGLRPIPGGDYVAAEANRMEPPESQ